MQIDYNGIERADLAIGNTDVPIAENSKKFDELRKSYFKLNGNSSEDIFEPSPPPEEIFGEYAKLSPREKRKIEEKKNAENYRLKLKEIFTDITFEEVFKEMFDYCRKRIVGQDKELKKAVYIICSYFYSYLKNKPILQKNWFLTAPSGMGKTEFFRAIRDFFKERGIEFPIVQIDLSQITETGFRGADINSVVPIIEKSCSFKLGGYGICFFDEADKKIIPSHCSNGENVNAKVQSNLLAFIEGIVIKDYAKDFGNDFDTNNTMFVFMGAFQEIRKQKSVPKKCSMGFNSDFPSDDDAQEDTAFYDDITIQDMLDCGMVDEFAGRVSQVINFHKIKRTDMKILIEAKIKNLEKECEMEIYTSPEALEQLISLAYGKLGIRTVLNKLTEIIIELESEAMLSGGFDAGEAVICIDSLDSYYIGYYDCDF